MQLTKKWIWIIGLSCIAAICLFFFYQWYKIHNAIKYAIAPTSVIAITGNDYESTLKKLHNIPLIGELENDASVNVLYSNDFLKLELAHAPGIKKLFKNKKHVLSFKAGTGNQLQSMLAVEAGRETFDSLMHEIIEKDYTIARYSAPSGEIIEAYNAGKQKELVLCFIYGVIVISSETLYTEETLNSIASHTSLFKKAELNFSSNYIYVKETAMGKWVDELTRNLTSEFYQWFESIEEASFALNEEGTLATASLFFKERAGQKMNTRSLPFVLENWLQNITSNYVGFHPAMATSEIGLTEIYRCYTNLKDENIRNNTFLVAHARLDSNALTVIFSKHSIESFTVMGKYRIYKFGKYPFFKNFCDGVTPDLPESYITLVSENIFVVTPSVATMIPLLQKINNAKPEMKRTKPGVFVMQVQPKNLLPYFSNIVGYPYRNNILQSTFLHYLDFVQYRLDTMEGNKGAGTISFNKNETTNSGDAELLWSKILDEATQKIIIIKSKQEGENFFLYQDEKSVLHCFDFSPKELWQKFILGKIETRIFNTDLYRNNQNQFYFNTSNQIYAIDGKGKDLSNFPKQFNNEELRGMYLFDMGDKYEYFFIDGNMIYGYDAGGASLEDWRPRESPVPIHKELIQYKKRNKNYIIGINRNGELLIWNRFGKRVAKDLDLGRPLNIDFFIAKGISKKYRPELIGVDADGEILSLTLDSLQQKKYRTQLIQNAVYFITQSSDSTFQKIIYQYNEKLVLFDRYTQLTDSLKLSRNFNLRNVIDVGEKKSFIVVSDGRLSKIISSHRTVVADKIEGDVLDIIVDEIPNHYFVVTFDQLKRVNLYKFSL